MARKEKGYKCCNVSYAIFAMSPMSDNVFVSRLYIQNVIFNRSVKMNIKKFALGITLTAAFGLMACDSDSLPTVPTQDTPALSSAAEVPGEGSGVSSSSQAVETSAPSSETPVVAASSSSAQQDPPPPASSAVVKTLESSSSAPSVSGGETTDGGNGGMGGFGGGDGGQGGFGGFGGF